MLSNDGTLNALILQYITHLSLACLHIWLYGSDYCIMNHHKHVSMASKFELPYISIPCIIGSANSVSIWNTCIKTAKQQTIVLQIKWRSPQVLCQKREVLWSFTFIFYETILSSLKHSSQFQRSLMSSSEFQSRKHAAVCYTLRGCHHHYVISWIKYMHTYNHNQIME